VHGIDGYLAQFRVSGRALVVGSKQHKGKADRRKLYGTALGLDMEPGEGVDIIHNLEKPLPDTFGLFDHIDCVSVLEHVKRPWLLCANIERAMAHKATLLISVPFIWRVHDYPGDYWRMTVEALPVLFPGITWASRNYMADFQIVKRPIGATIDGSTYMQKTEVVAFGIRNSDNANNVA
jgi:SAM-dependent methyltransferase